MARIKITKQVNQGDSVGVSASGINGYTFNNWTENGSVVSSSNPYTFTAQSSRLINATFNAPVVIVASSSDSDYGSVSGSGTYTYGSTVNLSATANSGYEFGGWTESGSVVSNNPSYSFTATSDRNLVATFNSVITVRTTGADTIYLYNKSNQTYTWNLSSGTNTYDGSVSGFELDNLKYVYKFTTSSGSSDNLITYVDISKTSIEAISNYAFCSCSALTTFIFPETLITIGEGAFTNSGLTTFTIPSSVKFVDNNSFYYSTWWNNYTGGAIYYKDNVCLGCDISGTSPTGSVSITSGTRVIATDAFTTCSGITSMSLPNSLKVINTSAFYYCSGLHSLTIPTSVEYIGVSILDNSGIYSDAADHTTLVVSNCVVGHKGSITGDVELPNTTRLLSAQSFAFQTGITSFTINRATPPIYCPSALDTAYNPGDGSCTSPIYVPTANVNDYKTADGWTAVASRIQGMVYYTISATVDPVAYGSVSGTGSYLVGSTCTLTFTPESGYMLKNWTESGTSVSTDNPYTFTVSGNRTLVCNAMVRTNPLVVKTNGAGSIKLKNNSNQVYTLNLENGTNNYYGTEPGFELNNLKSIYKSEGNNVNNNYITEINITSTSITQIPDYAFKNCKALTWIYPSDLTSIGNYAFQGCTAWTNYVYFPSTLQSIGQYAFDGSNISGEVNFTSSFTSLGQYAFQNTKITKLDLHLCSSLTEIPIRSFKGCTYLTQININKVRNIKTSAFSGCTSLTSITFNTSTSTPLTEIGEGAFEGCTSLSSFTIPSNGSYLTALSRSSFYNTAWWNNQAAGIVYKQNICFGPKTDPTAYTSDVSITSGTLIIAGYAFQDLYKSSITSDRNTVKHIYVPYTCTKIFRNAFDNVGGSSDIYDWDDWDDDGKPAHANLDCFVYGPVAIEIGDSTNGSNLTEIAACAFGYARIYEARGYSIDTDDIGDEYPTKYPGGQGYLKFYGTTCPTVNNVNVFTQSSYDMGDGDYATYTPKVYVKSASRSSYQTGLSAYLSKIELTTF